MRAENKKIIKQIIGYVINILTKKIISVFNLSCLIMASLLWVYIVPQENFFFGEISFIEKEIEKGRMKLASYDGREELDTIKCWYYGFEWLTVTYPKGGDTTVQMETIKSFRYLLQDWNAAYHCGNEKGHHLLDRKLIIKEPTTTTIIEVFNTNEQDSLLDWVACKRITLDDTISWSATFGGDIKEGSSKNMNFKKIPFAFTLTQEFVTRYQEGKHFFLSHHNTMLHQLKKRYLKMAF